MGNLPCHLPIVYKPRQSSKTSGYIQGVRRHSVASLTSSICTHSCCTSSQTPSTASIVCSCLCHLCRSSVNEAAATVPTRLWSDVLRVSAYVYSCRVCACTCVVCVCACVCVWMCVCVWRVFVHMVRSWNGPFVPVWCVLCSPTWWLSSVSNIPAVLVSSGIPLWRPSLFSRGVPPDTTETG